MMLRVLKHLNEDSRHGSFPSKPLSVVLPLENGGASLSKGQGAKQGKPGNHAYFIGIK